tara:strand:- start:60 stop:203 length:144 start_codon:yes stop_codon:yes gene_type:complete
MGMNDEIFGIIDESVTRLNEQRSNDQKIDLKQTTILVGYGPTLQLSW